MELPPFLANTSSSSSSSTLVAVCPSTNCPTSHSPSCSLTAHPMIVGAPNWVPHTATGLDGSEKAIIIGGDHQCTMLQVGNQHDHKYIMISPGVPQTTTAYSHQNPTVMCCGSSVHGHVHHHTEMIIDNGDMGQMTSSNMDPQDISVGITDLNGSKFRKLNFYPESHLHKLVSQKSDKAWETVQVYNDYFALFESTERTILIHPLHMYHCENLIHNSFCHQFYVELYTLITFQPKIYPCTKSDFLAKTFCDIYFVCKFVPNSNLV